MTRSANITVTLAAIGLTGCAGVQEKISSEISRLPSIDEMLPGANDDQIRLESNLPGTVFCLDGTPLLQNDPRVTVQAGGRVYLVKLEPASTTTVVAAKDGYFPFVDTVASDKTRLQFDFFGRNACKVSSKGRECISSATTSDLELFRQFCRKFP